MKSAMDMKYHSNKDGFEKFLMKLCVTPSGWDALIPIMYNAHWLFHASGENGCEWQGVNHPKLLKTKTGKMFRLGMISGEWDAEGSITYAKELLAEFGVWGLKNIDSDEIGAVSS